MSLEELLQNLYGIGPTAAKSLSMQLHDVFVGFESDISEEKLRTVLKKHKNIFDSLPVAAKVDLLYNPIKIIPREFIEILDKEMHEYLGKGQRIKFDIAGSYRRGKLTSRDIDVVVSNGKLGIDVVDQLISRVNHSKILRIMPPFARGPNKATTLFELIIPKNLESLLAGYPRRCLIRHTASAARDGYTKVRMKVDIFITEPDEYIFALLFATGSGMFNVRMRAVAKKRGLLLNQRGVYRKVGDKLEQIPVKTEKEIFEVVGVTYREPKNRVR